MTTPTTDEILEELTSHYKFLNEPIDETNVSVLRERLARLTEKIPKASVLRNHAQYRLAEAKQKARERIKNKHLTPTALRNSVEDETATELRVFDLSRKLHSDLTNISHNLRRLLDFEIADFRNGH